MKAILYNYDVFPKVFLGNREKTITVQPLGLHAEFIAGKEYTVKILKVNQSNPHVYPERSGRTTLTVTPDEDGCIRLTAYFEGEGEHYINFYDDPAAKPSFTIGKSEPHKSITKRASKSVFCFFMQLTLRKKTIVYIICGSLPECAHHPPQGSHP